METLRIEIAKEKLKLERLVEGALAKGLSLTGEEILKQSRKLDSLLNKAQAGGSNIVDIRSYRRPPGLQRPVERTAAACRILRFDPHPTPRFPEEAGGEAEPARPSLVEK